MKELDTKVVQKFCPACGATHAVEPGLKHCDECGQEKPPEEMHGGAGCCDECGIAMYPEG